MDSGEAWLALGVTFSIKRQVATTASLRLAIIGVTLVLGLLIAPLATQAQPVERIPRIGVLSSYSSGAHWSGFRQRLRELGWEWGRTLALEFRSAEGREERYEVLAGELVRLKLDVMVTESSQSARAAIAATSTIPIVMLQVAYPVEAGFVVSLARPGGNVTGVSNQVGDLTGKQLELLWEIAPGMHRLALLWDPNNLSSALGRKEVELQSQRMGLHFISVPVSQLADLEPAIRILTHERPDALFVHPVPVIWKFTQSIVDFAKQHRLPIVTANRTLARAGFLMSYGPKPINMGRKAAEYVDKILNGATPAELPVAQPTEFELIVNLWTAKKLGLTIPPTILFQATEVIK